ncbi:MAG: aspartate aminotransferase family protein [Gemmatimonadota bacterium]
MNEPLGSLLPRLRGEIPGPASRALARRLRAVESRNVTFVDEEWPLFWEEAGGANVRDADGNIFLDLTGAFGVALLGHAHPAVVAAVKEQADRLLHGMGDVHPPAVKVAFLERLQSRLPWPGARAVLAGSGSEAVEIALKTAEIHTGRSGVLAFQGGYHGLTLGSLATTHRLHFRHPFRRRVYGGVAFAPFPDLSRHGEDAAGRALEAVAGFLEAGAPNGDTIGAVLVEPVQGRAGVRVPAPGFMAELSRLARERGVLVIADEIFTGAGRCGGFLASEEVGLRADVVCMGKALGGGLPLGVCAGPEEVMEAWPESEGEAIHTSTFLGHPLVCAAGLAVLGLLDEGRVAERARLLGSELMDGLRSELSAVPGVREIRGLGLMVGIELGTDADPDGAGMGAAVARAALRSGVLLLPAGSRSQVVELTPPVCLTREQTAYGVEATAASVADALT